MPTNTTIPAQPRTAASDELQIVRTPPTVADAQLIIQIVAAEAASGADRGPGLLRQFETPPTLGQLRKKFAPGSEEHHSVMGFIGYCEIIATFVRQGILDEGLVQDTFWIEGSWRSMEKIVKGMRRETGEPRIMENIEWLANRPDFVRS